MCEAGKLPLIIVINKMDRENADFDRNVADVQATFGRQCVPFQIAIGAADSFKGVVNVVDLNADIPADLSDEVEAARERLIEAAAETPMNGFTAPDGNLQSGRGPTYRGDRSSLLCLYSVSLVPILATSLHTLSSWDDFILEMVGSLFALGRWTVKPRLTKSGSGDEVAYEADHDASLAAFVFMTTADPFVGKLSLFRVYQGTIRSNSEAWDANQGQAERVGQLYLPKGKSRINLNSDRDPAWRIGRSASMSIHLTTGDTLCARDNQVKFDPIEMPVGYYRVAVSPASKADLDKMSHTLTTHRWRRTPTSLRCSRTHP
ncbi:Elongation factor G [Geodia barretti]|uniref:Elongation factor G n=1 Tax=Geodia barretti TaxID=519541 RepID=A0AA35T387_GEOBA|nr:Elongation factor G [Geodia barretti]